MTSIKEKEVLACVSPLPDYEFQLINGKVTIVKWNGTEQHLVIPEAFLLEVDGEEKCVPVQVIGKAAFMQGDFKSIVIPESVHIIEEDNFVEIDIEEIEIPHSVPCFLIQGPLLSNLCFYGVLARTSNTFLKK